MGAINNAFNQIAGSLAVAGKLIGDEKAHAIAEGEVAKETLLENSGKLPGIREETEAAKKQIANLNKEDQALGDIANNLDTSNEGDEKTYAELSDELNRDKKMADIALLTAKAKAKTIKEQIYRATKKIATANKWLGVKEVSTNGK